MASDDVEEYLVWTIVSQHQNQVNSDDLQNHVYSWRPNEWKMLCEDVVARQD